MATSYRASTAISATGLANLATETHAITGTLSGDSDIVHDTQDIGTSSEQITFGEIAAGSAALIELVNLDDTHFISYGFENPAVAGTKTIKLAAGQSNVITTPSGALYAIADTATVKILKRAIET